jgi:hypothetical protein
MASIIVPEPIIKGLSTIALISEEQYRELYAALENLPTRISQKRIFDDSGIDLRSIPPADLAAIKEALFPIYLGRANINVPASEYANDIAQSLKGTDAEWTHSEEVLDRLKERLSQLLSLDRPRLIAKANDVLTEHERVYSKARIFSDIRPVFGESPEQSPEAAVIVHMLQIAYRQDGDRHEFIVALDTLDVQKLIDALERAKAKAESLKSVVSSTDMAYVEVV